MRKVLWLIKVLLLNVFAMLWLDDRMQKISRCMVAITDKLLMRSAAHLLVQQRQQSAVCQLAFLVAGHCVTFGYWQINDRHRHIIFVTVYIYYWVRKCA